MVSFFDNLQLPHTVNSNSEKLTHSNVQAWTLNTLMGFYVLFPFALATAKRLRYTFTWISVQQGGVILFFSNFRKWAHCYRLAIFMRSIPENRRNLLCVCATKFLFSKNHRDLKNEYFFESLQKPYFYIKEQLSQRKFKIIISLVLFYFSKKAKNIF